MSNASLLPGDIGWIHELAKNELNPEADNIFNKSNQFDPKQLIEESTMELLQELREYFTVFVRVFNNYSEGNAKFSDVKIYGISQTPADFMLFRNNVKLIFSNSAHGIVSASFLQHSRGTVSVDGNPLEQTKIIAGARDNQDIIAEMGPFLDVKWTFQGETISAERLVKYYFIEFIKLSRSPKKEALPNQQLLKQIKALLQDKGINF